MLKGSLTVRVPASGTSKADIESDLDGTEDEVRCLNTYPKLAFVYIN